jgi:hypothetical protein
VQVPTAPSPLRTPQFGAVIAHADEPKLLRRCIAHHLSIGVDSIFVSLNLDDPQSAAVPAEFAGTRVRAARLETFAADEFDYFTEALRAATQFGAPDWMLFIDSDEFWIPASGRIGDTAALDETDVYSVKRFNIPPIRDAHGNVLDFDASDAEKTLVIGERFTMDREFLDRNPDTPWLASRIGPKIMVRPELVETVAVGAHDIVSGVSDVRRTVPADLLIVHAPFTTPLRFRRKVDAIRVRLTKHADRYRGNLAWHWRRWVAIADAGRVDDEFAAQVIDATQVPGLLARGVLTTPARLFADDRLRCE